MDLKNVKDISLYMICKFCITYPHFLHIEDRQNSSVFLANSPENFSRIFEATGSHVWDMLFLHYFIQIVGMSMTDKILQFFRPILQQNSPVFWRQQVHMYGTLKMEQ